MLLNNPQKKGLVRQIRVVTPRKPNSARRAVAKLFLMKKKYTVAYIPGGAHTLKKYSNVLIHGGGARDTPGVYCSCIRGVKDLKGVIQKGRRRSIYGVNLREYLAFKSFGY